MKYIEYWIAAIIVPAQRKNKTGFVATDDLINKIIRCEFMST